MREAREIFVIPADHPAMPGHFPGLPILPAVMLLELFGQVARRHWPELGRLDVGHAKFLNPALPDRPLTVELRHEAPGRLVATCSGADGVLLARALLIPQTAPPHQAHASSSAGG